MAPTCTGDASPLEPWRSRVRSQFGHVRSYLAQTAQWKVAVTHVTAFSYEYLLHRSSRTLHVYVDVETGKVGSFLLLSTKYKPDLYQHIPVPILSITIRQAASPIRVSPYTSTRQTAQAPFTNASPHRSKKTAT